MQFRARTRLAKRLRAALKGERIARAERRVAGLAPVVRSSFKISLLKGKFVGEGPDFFEPMSEDELALWKPAEKSRP